MTKVLKMYHNKIIQLLKSEGNAKIEYKILKIEIDEKVLEINQKNNLLDRIFTNTHILIAYLDMNYNYVYVNLAYANYYKKDIKFYDGKNYFDLYPDEKLNHIFIKVVASGKPFIAFEKRFNYNETNNKDMPYWDWSLHPVKDKSGKIEGMILTLLDVSKKVKDKKDYVKTTEELSQSKRMSDLGLLAATVAHELRNPLSVIQAALYNIERKKENAQIDSQIRTIEKKILESEQIISNLLNYARIKTPVLKEVDIIQYLEHSIADVEIMCKNEGIKIEKVIGKVFNNIINVDSIQIKDVFNNILLNAFQSIKYNDGTVRISMETVNNMMDLTFEDTGSGIKKADLNKVFEPFFTRKTRGTGLGLSLCQEIINLHNGSITIESKLSKGTKIYIKLPYQEKQ